MASEIDRPDYAARYGPTAGDRIRLGDTNLLALIERDETSYGDEVLRGWGKTMRAERIRTGAPKAALPQTLGEAIEQLKRRMIEDALRECGSKTRAAEQLGLTRQSLQQMLRRRQG